MNRQNPERVNVVKLKSRAEEKRELTNRSGTSREGENGETVQPSSTPQQRKESLNKDKTEIPWVFTIFIKLQELMFSSPREVIISLLILAFLVSMLFSGKRR